ncbi:MAG TPA: hypothetical protein V6C81_05225 [Planktothrix sp.]
MTGPVINVRQLKVATLSKNSWQLLLDHWHILVLATAWHFTRNVLIGGVFLFFTVDSPSSPMIVLTVIVGLNIVSYLELPKICLQIMRGQKPRIFNMPDMLCTLSWLVTSLVFAFLVGLGLILLVIPGLFLAVRLSMYGFGIVDGKNPIEALLTSNRVVATAFKQTCIIFGAFLCASLILGNPVLMGADFALDAAMTFALCQIYTSSEAGRRLSDSH